MTPRPKPTGHSLSANITARLWLCLPLCCTSDAALLRLASRWHLCVTANCKVCCYYNSHPETHACSACGTVLNGPGHTSGTGAPHGPAFALPTRRCQPSELSLGGSRLLQTFLCLQCFAWDAVANMCNKAMEAVGRQAAGRLSAGRRNPAAQPVGQMTARA